MNYSQRVRWFFQGTTPDALRARRIVKIILILALFIGLFWVVPISEVLYAVVTADLLYLVLGLALALVSTFLTAAQLKPLVRQQNIERSTGQILVINLTAKFYSLFASSGLVAGGVKWYRLAQPGGKTAEALAALGFFRLLETFLNVTIGLSFWLLSDQSTVQVSAGWLGLLLLGIALFWILVTRLSMPIFTWFEAHTTRLERWSFWPGLVRRLRKLVTAVASYADMPAWDLFQAVFIGVVSHLIGILGNLYLARSVSIQLSFLELGWIHSIVDIATQMPFAVAGGLGIREVTLVATMAILGIGADLALAFSLLLFVKGVFLSMIGGVLEGYQALQLRRLT
jgi:uncharacterized membrane protein YbhN (UPF0104 family)